MLAVTVARDEADIIGQAVRTLVEQGARVVVADNLSTDHTADEAAAAGAMIEYDLDPAHRQGEKMTALAGRFAEDGEWVITFDADEIWLGLDHLTDDYDVAMNATHYHVRGDRRAPMNEPQPKVAFRWRPGIRIAEGNHGVDGAGGRVGINLLTVCHYQYRSFDQVRRKVAQGVAALDLAHGEDRRYGSHWRDLAALDDGELAEWWAIYQDQPTVKCHLSVL